MNWGIYPDVIEQRAGLSLVSTVALLTALLKQSNRAFARVYVGSCIGTFVLQRFQEKGADLVAAEHLDPPALAANIQNFHTIAQIGRLKYHATNDWFTKLVLSPSGNNRLCWPIIVDPHPPHTVRAEYLLDIYNSKNQDAPITVTRPAALGTITQHIDQKVAHQIITAAEKCSCSIQSASNCLQIV